MDFLYSTHFTDRRERMHVALVIAHSEQEAQQRLTKYQNDRGGFWYDIVPKLEDFLEIASIVVLNDVEIDSSEHVRIIYHQDYD